MNERVGFLVPRVDPHLPEAIRLALARRRQATLTGRCACGNESLLVFRPEPRVELAHEADCVATDDALLALLRRHGLHAERLEYELVIAERVA